MVELSCDLNLPSSKDNNSPLILATIRNRIEILKYLLEKGACPFFLNKKNLNCLDYAFLNCNYKIAYTLINKTKLVIRDLEDYVILWQSERTPIFNLLLFYQTLKNNLNPDMVPSFELTKEQIKSKLKIDI